MTDDERRAKVIAEGRKVTLARKAREHALAVVAKRKVIFALGQAGQYAEARYVRSRDAQQVAAGRYNFKDPQVGSKAKPRKRKGKKARGGTIGMNGRSGQQWQRERYQHWVKTGNWLHSTDPKNRYKKASEE